MCGVKTLSMAAWFRLSMELPMAWSGSNELMMREGSTRTVGMDCANAGKNSVVVNTAAHQFVLWLIPGSCPHKRTTESRLRAAAALEDTEQIMKKLALIVLAGGIAVWAQNRAPAPSPSPVSKLLRTLLESANS